MSSLRRTSYEFHDEILPKRSSAASSSGQQHHWQSMGTLERTKFVRLRKGYASVRKSFRLAGDKSYIQEPVGFMNQLGSRLLRSMRQGALGKSSEPEDRPVEGSFRVLSVPGCGTGTQPNSTGATTHRKSDAELDIEQRLKRSKRRTLASTRCHETPAAETGEAIYEELKLDELEAIKRDNLRLTLRGGASLETGSSGRVPMCSCRSLEPGSGLPDSFCCCNSAPASGSSSPAAALSQAGGELLGGASAHFEGFEGSKEPAPEGQPPDTAHGFKFFEGQLQVEPQLNGRLGGAKGQPQPQAGQLGARSGRAAHQQMGDFSNNKLQLSRSEVSVVGDEDETVRQPRRQVAPEAGQKLNSHRHKLEPAGTMRPARSEWTLSRAGAGDCVLASECGGAGEQLYVGAPHIEGHRREAQLRYWTRRLTGYEDYTDQSNDLFERQLHAAALSDQQHRDKRLTAKRSLLSKIKQFIVPSSTGKETITHISADHSYALQQAGRTFAHSTLNLAAHNQTTSHRYLTAGRKTINLVDYDDSARAKSHQLSFLTLGRQKAGHNGATARATAANIFQHHQHHHHYGSTDSLPSADSGLSSSNLQNLNEEQHYARIYSSIEPAKPVEQRQNFRFVGRATAKVDCNPCAYDKEALVFKRGDTIDIIERHHSGTWVGRCHGQVGHFKFINVTEMRQEEEEEEGARRQEPLDRAGATFVTKLEIKNDTNERPNGQQQQQQQSTQQDSSGQKSVVNYAAQQQANRSLVVAATCSPHRTEVKPIQSQKSRDAASTLEQLLFAIGLANEQVAAHHHHQQHQQQQQQQQQVSTTSTFECQSYIDIMNRAGLDSLESFSNISDCSELEQIGIHNREHQQRLLMAARIIRRASEAAKLDFIQNYQTTTVTQHHQSANSVRPTNASPTTEPAASIEYQQEDRCNQNEPIYVNLINGRLEEMPATDSNRVHFDGRQAQDQTRQSAVAFQRQDQSAQLSQPMGAKLEETPARALLNDSSGHRLFNDGEGKENDYSSQYLEESHSSQLEDLRQLAFMSNESNEQLPAKLSVFEQLYSTAKENASLHQACFNPLPLRRSKGCSSFTPVTTTTSYTPEHLQPSCQTITGRNGSSSLQQQQHFNNRSQVNPPTSAYDLRLDLSHFFS